MERIALDLIMTDAGTQMRSMIDESVVREYAENLASLPPITVFYTGSQYIPADGFHRIAAHSLAGALDIACDVRAGTVRDAILYAAGANASHGKRRSNADKRRAIEALLRDEEWRQKSDRWIADVVKVSDPTVGKVREELYPSQQVQKFAPEKSPEPRRVQAQDGKTYTVPQRSEPRPQNPQKSPPVVQVIEEPIAAPRVERQPVVDDLKRAKDRMSQLLAQLCDIRDDILSGDIDGDGVDEVLSSLELAITHLDAARSTEGT